MNRHAVLMIVVALMVAWSGVHFADSEAGAITQAAKTLRFRYSPPRIPTRPPPVRPRTPAKQLLHEQTVNRSVAALTVTSGTARGQLRQALSNGAGVRMGRAWNAHHVIPWSFRGHPTIQKAARGGFNLNGATNGLRIPADQHRQLHSVLNDPRNTAAVSQLLDALHTTRAHYTPEQVATVVRNHARTWKYDMIGGDSTLAQFNSEAPSVGAGGSGIPLKTPLTTTR